MKITLFVVLILLVVVVMRTFLASAPVVLSDDTVGWSLVGEFNVPRPGK
jgi:hypothetical protein